MSKSETPEMTQNHHSETPETMQSHLLGAVKLLKLWEASQVSKSKWDTWDNAELPHWPLVGHLE